jgi:uncharacterized protein (TIGR02599 family)
MNLLANKKQHPLFLNQRRRAAAFTLVEVLVSMVILAMMMLIITSVISQAQRSWKAASSRVSQFREARLAFDTITRNLRQASMDAHRQFIWGKDYYSTDPLAPPDGSARTADLGIKFAEAKNLVSGGNEKNLPGHAVVFQAPLGKTNLGTASTGSGDGSPGDPAFDNLKSLLCVRGYFVQFGTDASFLPEGLGSRLQAKNRYRLFEYQPTAEKNAVYTVNRGQEWAQISLSDAVNEIRPVAENILMLAFAVSFAEPSENSKPSLAGDTAGKLQYGYDSYNASDPALKHRLPRYVQVIMIAMDEESAARLEQKSGGSPPDSVGASGAQFTSPDRLYGESGDLAKVRNYMDEARLNYRIFSASVLVIGSES